MDQENAYLPHGQNSQDTPELAAWCREIYGIQHCHRAQVHHGEPHSQTLPLQPLTILGPTLLSLQQYEEGNDIVQPEEPLHAPALSEVN